MIRSHVFESSAEAYDASQTSDAIRDGDVLVVPSEKRVAVLVEAWPVDAVPHVAGHDTFHALADGVTWETFRDGQYLGSAGVAVTLYTLEVMKDAGLTGEPARHIRLIAAQLGWTGEIPKQERYVHERDDSHGAG